MGARVDAFILAAGHGTRLRPLTDTTPKCLVKVGGTPMLERTARRLTAAGAGRLVINVCPFAEEIERFVVGRGGFDVEVRFSREAGEPLETGGGLLAARPFFRQNAPFFIHNADVYTDLDLGSLYGAHGDRSPLVTLAVMERPSSRGLLFDDRGLVGRANDDADGNVLVREPDGAVVRFAFACVHVAAPELFDLMTERGRFGIFETYLRLAKEGARILPHRVDGGTWVDIGRPEQLAQANALAAAEEAR